MICVVLDVNVWIAALLSHSGTPARLVRAWLGGAFDIVVSPGLLDELERALTYPKVRTRIPAQDARDLVATIHRIAIVLEDLEDAPSVSMHPDDDYIVALARAAGAHMIVSGDKHLTGLVNLLPRVATPAEAAAALGI